MILYSTQDTNTVTILSIRFCLITAKTHKRIWLHFSDKICNFQENWSRSTAVIGVRNMLVTFQYVQALLVGRVRLRVVWGAEAATICVSYPVSTVTRMLRPQRRSYPFWSCTSICMWYEAQVRHHILTWYAVKWTNPFIELFYVPWFNIGPLSTVQGRYQPYL